MSQRRTVCSHNHDVRMIVACLMTLCLLLLYLLRQLLLWQCAWLLHLLLLGH